MTTNAGKVPKTAKRPQPKGGSRKGAPNKNTAAIKDMILSALHESGGVDYLVRRANDPKTAAAFLGLVGKVLPMQIANAEGEEFRTVARVELVAMRANRPD
jgi:hypothetical protein